MAQILTKGTKILCPRKRHLIGTLNRDVNTGEIFGVNRIDFESGQERVAGEPSKCKLCSSVYFIQNKLYTDNGWLPSDPLLEPVARK